MDGKDRIIAELQELNAKPEIGRWATLTPKAFHSTAQRRAAHAGYENRL